MKITTRSKGNNKLKRAREPHEEPRMERYMASVYIIALKARRILSSIKQSSTLILRKLKQFGKSIDFRFLILQG